MKKLIVLYVILFVGINSCTAQKTEIRTAGPFERLKILGAVNVIYTNSDTSLIKVEASERSLATVETKLEDSTLLINNNNESSKGPVTVYIQNNRLTLLEVGGTCSFKTTNSIKSETLAVSLSGASHASINGELLGLYCTQSGASSLVMKGRSDVLDLNISGASVFKGYDLNATNASVTTTGASSTKVFVTEKLRASANGASTIKIKGNPKELYAESTSAASITRLSGQHTSNEKNESDTVTYVLRNKKIMVIDVDEDFKPKIKREPDDDEFKHWAGLSIGVNGFLNATGGLKVQQQYKYMDIDYSRSFNFQFNLIERQFNLVGHYMKLITGFGFDYRIYSFSNNTNLRADSSFTWGTIDTSNFYQYEKNVLRSTYLQVPLLLEFNSSNNPQKTFHIAFGVIGQYRIASRTKQKLEHHNDAFKKVRKDNYNLNPFAAKAHVNMGYRSWTIFGEYNFTSLFEKDKGPELYPFTIGIRVIPFT